MITLKQTPKPNHPAFAPLYSAATEGADYQEYLHRCDEHQCRYLDEVRYRAFRNSVGGNPMTRGA